MDENMTEYCRLHGVDFRLLREKVQAGIDSEIGSPPTTFTDDELCVIKTALEIAGGL